MHPANVGYIFNHQTIVMKNIFKLVSVVIVVIMMSCNSKSSTTQTSSTDDNTSKSGQEAVKDDDSQKDIVKLAVNSKDHKTLVAALNKADLVLHCPMPARLPYSHQQMMLSTNFLQEP